MKQFLLDLLEYIIDILLNRERHEIVEEDDEPIINEIEIPKEEPITKEEPNEVSTPDTSEKEPIIEEKPQEPTIEQEKPKQTEKPIENVSNEPYKMLSLKERQTYLKKLGLYSKNIDGIVGNGHKKAVRQFNVIFLNKNVETYFEETDKLLKEFYNLYCQDAYMTNNDWKYFKNLQYKEYACKCKKYCNGHPHRVHKRLIMEDQYLRNIFNSPININSGDRCTTHNKNVGGVSNSTHMYCSGSDKQFKNIKSDKVLKEIKSLEFNRYCYAIGTYAVHGDVKR